jgi:hypothetical protein
MDPNWISAIAAVGAVVAATVYAFITSRLLSEQRRNWIDDKFPCIFVRWGNDPCDDTWTIRLVNVGRGPAFIEFFHTSGFSSFRCGDGDHTQEIDKVIGPDVGDPTSQVRFALGSKERFKPGEVTVVIRYRDIAGRLFESGVTAGKPVFEPAKGFCGML